MKKENIITLSPFSFIQALSNLEHYFGITKDYFPEQVSQWTEESCKSPTSIEISLGWDSSFFPTELSALEIDSAGTLVDTLNVLTHLLRTNPSMIGRNTSEEMFRSLIRRDLLRLFIFFYETRESEDITLRCGRRETRLANYSGWIQKEWITPFLEEKLHDIKDPLQAKAELDSYHPKRGRRFKDARIPILIWGTFEMISDAHKFRTPMPDVLCEFLIKMMQVQDVIGENTDIDTLWIRAQLRYIRERETKPRFPIWDQSSIMKGAQ